MEIGKQIKKARKARDVTQKQLGEAIGFSEAHISYIETGKRNISVDKIKQIVKVAKEILKGGIDKILNYFELDVDVKVNKVYFTV